MTVLTRPAFESTGEGAPVLLVNGLAMTGGGWWRTVPVLAESMRVITFDHAGVGQSESAPARTSVGEMADDAVEVLDAAGVERAHVYGVSLGGMVAQEIALRHPDRVDALVLGATTPGGWLAAQPGSPVVSFFLRNRAMPTDEAVWASVAYSYARTTQLTRSERIAEDVARRLKAPVGSPAYAAQVAAGVKHDALARLGGIMAPTLVVHGEEDMVVDPANARTLARRIPGARIETWPGAGHIYMTDEPEADRRIADFLERQSSDPAPVPPPRSSGRPAPGHAWAWSARRSGSRRTV